MHIAHETTVRHSCMYFFSIHTVVPESYYKIEKKVVTRAHKHKPQARWIFRVGMRLLCHIQRILIYVCFLFYLVFV